MPTITFANGETLSNVRSLLNDRAALINANETKLATVESGATQDQNSGEVPYDNTASGLVATNVKDAIDEVVSTGGADPNTVVSVNSKPGPDVDLTALDLPFDNTGTSLVGPDTQKGLIELDSRVTELEAAIPASKVTYTPDGNLPPSGVAGDALVSLDARTTALEAAKPGGVVTVNGDEGAVSVDASIPYDNGTSALTANTVQGAIDEIVALGLAIITNAASLTYDNGASGLASANIQAAIDELAALLSSLVAASVAYNNGATGLSATNVQDAIDELALPPASGITFDNSGSGTSVTNVQAALIYILTRKPINTFAADHTLDSADGSVLMDTTLDNRTLTLPAPAPNASRTVKVKNVGSASFTLTIDAVTNGSTIDGQPTFETNIPNLALTLHCDGTSWWIL